MRTVLRFTYRSTGSDAGPPSERPYRTTVTSTDIRVGLDIGGGRRSGRPGAAQRRPRRAHPHGRPDHQGQRLHPLQLHHRLPVRRDPRRRPSRRRPVRRRHHREQLIGIIQEVRPARHPGPAGGRERAAGPRRQGGQDVVEITCTRSSSTTCSASAPATRSSSTATCWSARPEDGRVAAHRRVRDRPKRSRRPDACRAASSTRGTGRYQATKVGRGRRTRPAGRGGTPFKLVHSELRDGINRILRVRDLHRAHRAPPVVSS